MVSKNDLLAMKAEGLKKITEHARDYLSFTMTIPLGNKALKQVHTNQFLFCDLPKEFQLENWGYIAAALNSAATRFSQANLKLNRWYIEATDISVDVSGKAEMKLTLNAFASSVSGYTQSMRDMQNAYTNAVSKTSNQSSGKTKSKSKNKSNAVTTKKSVLNQSWIKKYKISSTITKQVEKICKVGKSDYDNVKLLFKWCDKNLPYEGYSGKKYGAEGTLKKKKGNCVDHALLFAAMCRSMGVKCNYIHNKCCGKSGHVYNKVYINNKSYIVDTGRDCASWGSHWGNAGCPVEKTSW